MENYRQAVSEKKKESERRVREIENEIVGIKYVNVGTLNGIATVLIITIQAGHSLFSLRRST